MFIALLNYNYNTLSFQIAAIDIIKSIISR